MLALLLLLLLFVRKNSVEKFGLFLALLVLELVMEEEGGSGLMRLEREPVGMLPEIDGKKGLERADLSPTTSGKRTMNE